jgi:hypothetical protein
MLSGTSSTDAKNRKAAASAVATTPTLPMIVNKVWFNAATPLLYRFMQML